MLKQYPVMMLSLNHKYITTFSTIEEAAIYVKTTRKAVSPINVIMNKIQRVCDEEQDQAYDHVWILHFGEENINSASYKDGRRKYRRP